MNKLALILTLCLGTAALAFAGDLTDAAKGSKAKRKKSTSKVITNADVKKSKGVLVKKKGTGAVLPPAEKGPTSAEKHEADRKARLTNQERLRVLNESIAQLERELARLEQSYYEENDLNRRDTEIVRRFEETKKKLDEARNAAVSAAGPQASTPANEP
jgi:hypothetical protein